MIITDKIMNNVIISGGLNTTLEQINSSFTQQVISSGQNTNCFALSKSMLSMIFLCTDHLFLSTPLRAQLMVTVAYLMVECVLSLCHKFQ